jgi:hypothetical protein
MRKILAALLIVVSPLTLVAVTGPLAPAFAATVTELGDLSALSAIAQDTLVVAKTGDMVAAQKRITDFESAWDKAAGTMQPLSPPKWRAVDLAADRAIEALRTASPNQADVEAAVSGLIAELDNPGSDAATAPAATAPAVAVALAVTNADGSALPCEVALKTLRDAAAGKAPSDQAKYDELMNKGLERCNADDDKRADGFFADAFALLS